MGKALDFADASEEVVDLLCESLLVDATPINVKIARLYLLSDILHNSSAPVRNASSYRMHIQKSLPKIFEHMVSGERWESACVRVCVCACVRVCVCSCVLVFVCACVCQVSRSLPPATSEQDLS